MSAKKENDTLKDAHNLLGHLPEPLNGQLKVLLDRADKGQDTTIEIIKLLEKHDNVRLWMNEQASPRSAIKNSGLRGSGQLGGDPSSVTASQKWVCPKSSCKRWILVIQEGEDPPICKVDKIEMVREKTKKG
jgi:hypothetical protein